MAAHDEWQVKIHSRLDVHGDGQVGHIVGCVFPHLELAGVIAECEPLGIIGHLHIDIVTRRQVTVQGVNAKPGGLHLAQRGRLAAGHLVNLPVRLVGKPQAAIAGHFKASAAEGAQQVRAHRKDA